MTKNEDCNCEAPAGHHGRHMNRNMNNTHGGNAVYGLGFIGAIVYYFSTATSFWLFVIGFLKAMVWPAFLVYEALKYLNM